MRLPWGGAALVLCQAGGVESEVGGERPREPLADGKNRLDSISLQTAVLSTKARRVHGRVPGCGVRKSPRSTAIGRG